MAWNPIYTFSVTWDNITGKPLNYPTIWSMVADKPSSFPTTWGNIGGTLANQTDLQNALNSKADNSDVVYRSGSQVITGTKTFWTLNIDDPSGNNDIRFGARVIGLRDGRFYLGVSANDQWANFGNTGTNLNGPVVSSGSMEATEFKGNQVISSSATLTLSSGSTSGSIRFRPSGQNHLTGQMELASSGTLTSRNGHYYSSTGELRLGSPSNYIEKYSNGTTFIPGRVSANADNTYPCGGANFRWTEVYATNGSINTSDDREKQDFRGLTEAELRCGIQLARDAQIFKWKHAVEEKGEAARMHCSPTVQQVISTMESFGLDPFRYGFVCYDEWDETPAVYDKETGELVKEAMPAGNRYSLRPDELRSFVDAAIVARQDDLENRLAKLEGGSE